MNNILKIRKKVQKYCAKNLAILLKITIPYRVINKGLRPNY